MRLAVALAVVLVLSFSPAALAQPVTRPSRCEVTIARAPDEVREVIEDWVRAEPRCSTTLEVRVVPTEGGLYLFARDGNGRIHERVVPDGQTAAVLVASWVADDSSDPGGAPNVNVNVDVHVDGASIGGRAIGGGVIGGGVIDGRALDRRAPGLVMVGGGPEPAGRTGFFIAGGPIFAGVAIGGEVAIGGYLEPNLKLAVTGMAVSILPAGGDAAYAAGLKLTHVGSASRWRFDYGIQASIVSIRPSEIAGWTSGGHIGVGWELSKHVGLGVELAAAVARVDNTYVPAGWASLVLERSL